MSPSSERWKDACFANQFSYCQTYLIDNDDKFLVPGYHLDTSWILCTISAGVSVLCAVGLAASALLLPPEDGYEFLDDPISA